MADSWWLKVKRAQKHMVDIKRAADAYADRHAYEFVRVEYPKGERKIGYRVHVIDDPDPIIAVMLGDFIHNLRSALDHIIVACVPPKRRKSAGYPILWEDIWARDGDGNFVVKDAEQRQTDFETLVGGADPRVKALVIQTQPYHLGDRADRWTLGLISRLENADKHRRLITIGGGLRHPMVTWRFRDESQVEPYALGADNYLKQGTIVGWDWDGSMPTSPSEVHMEIRGAAEILVKIAPLGGEKGTADFRLSITMLSALQATRMILRALDPFVLR